MSGRVTPIVAFIYLTLAVMLLSAHCQLTRNLARGHVVSSMLGRQLAYRELWIAGSGGNIVPGNMCAGVGHGLPSRVCVLKTSIIPRSNKL